MNKQVGERIKELRSKLGWTQAELANKSGFTPQTVSNWESGSREPDIETLVKLAFLFNVSLDYLLSGKETEEKVVIMSRIEMAAKKDDPSIIQDLGWMTNYTKDENGKNIMDYVVQYKSKRVFEVMFNSCSHETHYDVLFDCKYFNEASNKTLRIIEFLLPLGKELSYAKIARIADIRKLNEFTPQFINQRAYNAKAKEELLQGYLNIFKYLVENIDSLGAERKEYYFGPESGIIDRNNCWSYAYPYFIDLALKSGNKKLFYALVGKLEPAYEPMNQRAEEMKRQGYNTHQIYRDTQHMFNEKPLEETFQYAMSNEMFDEAELLNGLLESKHSEREIKLARMKASKEVPVKERLVYEFTKDYILDYVRLLDSSTVVVKGPSKDEDKDKYYENLLKQYKDIYHEIMRENPISQLELAYLGVKNNDLSKLYQWSIDHGFDDLTNLIASGDTKTLLKVLSDWFVLREKDFDIQERVSGHERQTVKTLSSYKYANNRARESRNTFRNLQAPEFLYKLVQDLYERQVLPLDAVIPEDVNEGVKFFEKIKEEKFNNWVSDRENAITRLKNKKKNAEEYNRIAKEITLEYLNDELKKGNEENVIIKLCVRLESILKHKYAYDGDLFTMLDSFFSGPCAYVEAYKPYDDYDNNYRTDMENYERQMELNEKHQNWVSYLSKLRMKRNSIVHSEKNNVELSKEDLKTCINIVWAIDKGE